MKDGAKKRRIVKSQKEHGKAMQEKEQESDRMDER